MTNATTVWIVRLAGLALLSTAIYTYVEGATLAAQFTYSERLGMFPDEIIFCAIVAMFAVSLRLLVFGWPTWVRVGVVLLLFAVLDFVLHILANNCADTKLYCEQAMEIIVGIYILLPAAASLVLAAVPMFDARFRRPRLTASA